ncbi:MAG: AsmA family protein [Rickettsiales bacterium]|jgi:hypothetical protein|nr:AsmA family protein [Rickettsiales bacterium]
MISKFRQKRRRVLRFFRFLKHFTFWSRMVMLSFMAAAVSFGIFIYKVDPNDYKDRIISEIESAGIDVDAKGSISWEVSFRPIIVFENVALTAPGAKATMSKLLVKINLISLFRERATIEQISINNLNLEILENGNNKKSSAVEGGGDRIIGNIPAHEIMLRNPKVKLNGETYNPQLLRLTLERRADADVVALKIIHAGEVYDARTIMAPLNSDRKVYPVRATIQGGGINLTTDIALEQNSLVPISFKVRGAVRDMGGVLVKLGADAPKIMPFNITAGGGFGHGSLKLSEFSVQNSTLRAGSGINISGDINWGAPRGKLNVKLKSDRLVLGEVFPDLYGGPKTKWIHPNRPLNAFKDTPMPIAMLKTWDIAADLDLKSLNVYRNLTIRNSAIKFNWKNASGAAKIDAGIAGGKVAAVILGDIDGDEIYASAAGRGTDIITGKILDEIEQTEFLSRLPSDFEFALKARGGNLSRIMSTVSGPVQVYSTGRGYAHRGMATYLYGQDLLTSLGEDVKNLFRSNKDEDQIRVDCAALNLKVRKGVVSTRRGIAVESNVFNVNVAGDVDLGAEKIRATISSRPVSGLRLSVTGDLISLIEFEGNLAEPDIKLNRSGLLNKVAVGAMAGIALAPLTGGASIAVGLGAGWLGGNLISSWFADNNPCKTAMSQDAAPMDRNDTKFMRMPLAESAAEIFDDVRVRLSK